MTIPNISSQSDIDWLMTLSKQRLNVTSELYTGIIIEIILLFFYSH